MFRYWYSVEYRSIVPGCVPVLLRIQAAGTLAMTEMLE